MMIIKARRLSSVVTLFLPTGHSVSDESLWFDRTEVEGGIVVARVGGDGDGIEYSS